MIHAAQAHLSVYAVTHAGMSGKNNEDRYAVSAFQLAEDDPTPSVLAVLADGIGGHRAGEVAADMAVETISQLVGASDARSPKETLTAAVQQASDQIYAAAQSDPNRAGMGSTCACAWIIQERLYTAAVGDSRIYLLRGGSISQLTTDHTWLQEAVSRGILTPEQAKNHPNQHVIRRYLGSPLAPLVDHSLRLAAHEPASDAHQGMRLQPGDRLLLCSDGLTDLVSDGEILAALNRRAPDSALQHLVDLANARGGHDNITIVLLHAPVEAAAPRRRRAPAALLAAAALLLLAVIAVVVWGLINLVTTITRVDPPTPTAPLVTVTGAPGQATPSPAAATTATPAASPAAPSPSPRISTPIVLPSLPAASLTPWPNNTPTP